MERPTTLKTRPIPTYPAYAITAWGRVWSTRTSMWLTAYRKDLGYDIVTLSKGIGGKQVQKRVNRLVLEAWVGPCPEGMEACHNDGNRRNNALSNLRWDTHAANMRDARAHGVLSSSCTLTDAEARQICHLGQAGQYTQQEIADMFGVSVSTAHSVIRKKAWKHLWI